LLSIQRKWKENKKKASDTKNLVNSEKSGEILDHSKEEGRQISAKKGSASNLNT